MNKIYAVLIAIMVFSSAQLNFAAQGVDLETERQELIRKKESLEKVYAPLMLSVASLLSIVAGASAFGSYNIFTENKTWAGISRFSYFDVLKEAYSNMPVLVRGERVVPSQGYVQAVSFMDALSGFDKYTTKLGLFAPALGFASMVAGGLALYQYRKAAGYKKQIAEINEKIALLNQQ